MKSQTPKSELIEAIIAQIRYCDSIGSVYTKECAEGIVNIFVNNIERVEKQRDQLLEALKQCFFDLKCLATQLNTLHQTNHSKGFCSDALVFFNQQQLAEIVDKNEQTIQSVEGK